GGWNQAKTAQRMERTDPWNKRRLAVPVQRLQREPACVRFAAFTHELDELPVHREMSRESFVAQLGKTALNAQRHAWPIQQHRSLEALPVQPGCLQQIDQASRPFERHGVKRDQSLLPRLGFDVWKY